MKPYFVIPKIILPLTICFFLISCITGNVYDRYYVDEARQKENVYYIPISPNTPLVYHKNDISLRIQLSAGSKHSALEAQAAYLPTKHLGLTSAFSIGGNHHRDDYGFIFDYPTLNHHNFELGAGYLTSIGKLWHFESYGGLGTGKIKNYHYTGISNIRNNYIFLQPGVAFRNEILPIQLAFVSRFVGNNFFNVNANFIKDREPLSANQFTIMHDQPFHVFWEPGIIFQFGWNQFLFHMGYTLSSDLTNNDLYRAKGNFSVGFKFKLNAKKIQ